MLIAGVSASPSIHFPSSARYSAHGDAKTSHRRFFASPLAAKNALKWSALVGGHGFSLAARKGSRLSKRRVGGVRCEATVAEKETVESPAEKFEYQAEVSSRFTATLKWVCLIFFFLDFLFGVLCSYKGFFIGS
jgi:hypothetical protein